MGNRAVVLEDVEVLCIGSFCELLCDGLFDTNHAWLARSAFERSEAAGKTGSPCNGLLARSSGAVTLFKASPVRGGWLHTKTSLRYSSGISVSFSPWNLGITSCYSFISVAVCLNRGNTCDLEAVVAWNYKI